MDAILTISCEEMGDVDLQYLTDDLCQTLNRERGIEATYTNQPVESGTKTADPIAIGQIALALVGGGGVVVTLINVLNTYLSRVNHLEIELKNEKGESIRISGNLKPEQLSRLTGFINKFRGARE
jgi:hypothetical protein